MLRRGVFTLNRLAASSHRLFSAAAPAGPITGLPLEASSSTSTLPGDSREPSPRVAALVEQILALPLLEVSDLNTALKKRLNIPDGPIMAPGMFAAMAAAPAAAAPTAESAPAADIPQKMTFKVKLTKFDEAKKIALIKEIRNFVPGLNLVQAKKFVETAPVTVKEDLGKQEAEELKSALEKVGAVIEIA